jgi:hypothetical protein
MAHREWRQRLKELTDKINIDELAKLLGLTSWDEQEEYALSYITEAAGIEEGDSDAEVERKEMAVQDDVYRNWHDAVESVADEIFDQHNMELQPLVARGRKQVAYEYRIVPRVSWADVASKLIDTINGVGMWEFNSVKELKEVGPYNTVKQAVLAHLGHIKRRPEVYGTSSPRTLYERAWRD